MENCITIPAASRFLPQTTTPAIKGSMSSKERMSDLDDFALDENSDDEKENKSEENTHKLVPTKLW